MGRPLAGIKVVEVAMWAFVPAAGGILSDMGADVIKVEPPDGDPIRNLVIGMEGATPFNISFESYNRGKRSITLDLRMQEGRDVLDKLLADADVLLTNLLPPARKRMGIDYESIRARFPNIIYATGSGLGQNGPECDKGGFDAITFWARGGVAASLTEEGAEHPVGVPGPAFGDTLSGSMLAGAVAAAIAQRAMTGEASQVDVSLLGAAMWAMQRGISQTTMEGLRRMPSHVRDKPRNVLVHTYRTKDKRFVGLNMLQADRYWAPLMNLAGRPDLAAGPGYKDDAARYQNIETCMSEMKALFASKTLDEWIEILSAQEGQWDVVKEVGELKDDPQVVANNYLQTVPYENGRVMRMVSVPMQFDGEALKASPAPETGAHSEAILTSLGYDEDAIINLKINGVVF